MRILTLLALLLLVGCEKPMNPLEIEVAIMHCERYGLRVKWYTSPASGKVVDYQCVQ